MLSSFIPQPVRALLRLRPSVTQAVAVAPPPEALRDMARWQQRLTDINSSVRTDAAEELSKIASTHPDLADQCCASLLSYFEEVLPHAQGNYGNSGALWALAHHMSRDILAKHERLLLAALKVPTSGAFAANAMMRFSWHLVRGGREMPDFRDFTLPIDHAAVPAILAAARAVLREEHQGGRSEALRILDWAEDHGLISRDEAVEAATPPQAAPNPDHLGGSEPPPSYDEFLISPQDPVEAEFASASTISGVTSLSSYSYRGRDYPVKPPFTLNQVWRSKGGRLWRVFAEQQEVNKPNPVAFVKLFRVDSIGAKGGAQILQRRATDNQTWEIYQYQDGTLLGDIMLYNGTFSRLTGTTP